MVKIKLSDDGIVKALRAGDLEVDKKIVGMLIPNVTKYVDGEVSYRVSLTCDDNGYIQMIGTDPDGQFWVAPGELQDCVIGATKLTDGHLAVDTDKAAELAEIAAIPAPTEQDTISAALLKTTAGLQLSNAMLLKEVATLRAEEVKGDG